MINRAQTTTRQWLWRIVLLVALLSGYQVQADSPLPSPLPTPTGRYIRPTPLPRPTATFTPVSPWPTNTQSAANESPILPPPPVEPTTTTIPAILLSPTASQTAGHAIFLPIILQKAIMSRAKWHAAISPSLVQRRAQLFNQFLLYLSYLWEICGVFVLLLLGTVILWAWHKGQGGKRG